MQEPPAESLQEFTLFPHLPVEIQLAIYELAISTRLFILLPYPGRCRPVRPRRPTDPDPEYDDEDGGTIGPILPKFSWVVHPRRAVVPALLHMCHRSRDFLLRMRIYEPAPTAEPKTRFSSPVVSYAHDVFAVCPNHPRKFQRVRPGGNGRHALPQLIGIDRRRIQHVAWFQASLRPPLAGHYYAHSKVPRSRLPKLKSLTLIETEYVGREKNGRDSEWLEATTSLSLKRGRPDDDLFLVLADQEADYELLEIPLDPEREALGILANFTVQPADCAENRSSVWTRHMQDFYAATYLARACLWHQRHRPVAATNVAAGEAANNDYQTLLDCLHVPTWDEAPCPLCDLPPATASEVRAAVNGTNGAESVHKLGGHTMADLKNYQPPFDLRYGYLCRTPLIEFVAKNGFRILYDGPPQRDPKDALRFVSDMQRLQPYW